ncbi:hypothetical protein GGI1_12545 [Acidithiobacillus sp. GGI-221]|nr:hypothetical protein GGI1_12545 [Acidithiobacillus sp. GGI-221]
MDALSAGIWEAMRSEDVTGGSVCYLSKDAAIMRPVYI